MPDASIVILTVSETEENLIAAIEAGAKGYLLKNLDSQTFIASLRNLERGEAAITNEMVSHLMSHISRRAKQSVGSPLNSKIILTDREQEILQLISKGMSNRAISEKLFISENTVKYHIKNLLQKLSLKNRAEAAAYAIHRGVNNP
jgi:DNA-binding NarL/FixJ family response regulator